MPAYELDTFKTEQTERGVTYTYQFTFEQERLIWAHFNGLTLSLHIDHLVFQDGTVYIKDDSGLHQLKACSTAEMNALHKYL